MSFTTHCATGRGRHSAAALLGLALLLILAVSAAPAKAAKKSDLYSGAPAKYVFLFIGDGMGIPQRAATDLFAGKDLLIDSFPAQGITTTYANDRFITGSAASATALASGQKTNINYLGMDPAKKPVKTLGELAKAQGKKVGVISSVSIDHATPAAFYAHVPHRSMYYDVDVALAESGFDFFGGGGLKDPANKKGKAKVFKGDALEMAKRNGYTVTTDRESFTALKKGDGKVLAINANLPDGKALPYAVDRTDADVSLAEFTAKAIDMLENPKGFFIMVEGGKIDWACHANDAKAAIDDTLAFDAAVREAFEFYRKHPDDTLIVVTGDHECGGMTLGFAGTRYDSHIKVLESQSISFQKFTDENLKLFKAECGAGCRFEHIEPAITHYFGLKFEGDPKADPMVVEDYQLSELKDAFARSMSGEEGKNLSEADYIMYGAGEGYDPLTTVITRILNNKAGLAWTSYQHTGVPVSTSAVGVGADVFNGMYDNTDIAMKLMSVMGMKPKVYARDEAPVRVASN